MQSSNNVGGATNESIMEASCTEVRRKRLTGSVDGHRNKDVVNIAIMVISEIKKNHIKNLLQRPLTWKINLTLTANPGYN